MEEASRAAEAAEQEAERAAERASREQGGGVDLLDQSNVMASFQVLPLCRARLCDLLCLVGRRLAVSLLRTTYLPRTSLPIGLPC